MYRLKLEIPELPKSFNSLAYAHWWIKSKEGRKWDQIILIASSGKQPAEPLSKAFLRLTRCSSKAPDFDGLVSSFKFPIDALVRAKVLKGDTMDIIGQPEYFWKPAKQKKGSVILEVRDAEAQAEDAAIHSGRDNPSSK